MSAPPVARICAASGCGVSLDGRPPSTRYCSGRCRKAAYRDGKRAERGEARRRRSDPEQPSADAEAFRRQLATETERSLARDPSRWRHGRAADPDEHRAKPRRPDSDARRKP